MFSDRTRAQLLEVAEEVGAEEIARALVAAEDGNYHLGCPGFLSLSMRYANDDERPAAATWFWPLEAEVPLYFASDRVACLIAGGEIGVYHRGALTELVDYAGGKIEPPGD